MSILPVSFKVRIRKEISERKIEKGEKMRKLSGQKGIVFVTVVVIVLAMTTAALTAISINISQINLSEKEIQRLQADLLTDGALAISHTSSNPNFSYAVSSNHTNYNVSSSLTGAATGPNGTDTRTLNVTYY